MCLTIDIHKVSIIIIIHVPPRWTIWMGYEMRTHTHLCVCTYACFSLCLHVHGHFLGLWNVTWITNEICPALFSPISHISTEMLLWQWTVIGVTCVNGCQVNHPRFALFDHLMLRHTTCAGYGKWTLRLWYDTYLLAKNGATFACILLVVTL